VITVADLRAASLRLRDAMEAEADALNTADGALGDGDLGVTMRRGSRAIAEKAPDLPDDFGMALMACAQAFTKVSASSYGTLLATGLMAAAKATKGRDGIDPAELPALLAVARDKMMARGKAELGGKTVLDSIDAMVAALDSADDPAAAALRAAEDAQAVFGDRPATVGRARIYGEKSVGMEDPGMLAMTKIVKALTGQ
jgi:dihydroxyacetone kinase-like protein